MDVWEAAFCAVVYKALDAVKKVSAFYFSKDSSYNCEGEKRILLEMNGALCG